MSIDVLDTLKSLYTSSGIALFVANPKALIMIAVACVFL